MEQKRTLYKHFFEAAQQCEESDFAMKFIFKYLGSFDGESPEVLDAARDSAISCISSVIKVPKVFQMDHLLDFDVVNNLNGHPSYDLLDIFVNGNLEDYYKFYGENSDLISKLDLDHNSNVRKMRLLTLISLAHGKNEVEYSLIETSLQLRREDIEVWIINAIGAELLEGKLDQMNSKLLVRRAIYRNFSTSHWQQIYDRLSTWQANIASLLESLE
ncbi:eukaryotic translation initiation factor 3 subunit M-like [Zophobas morio]|uniref:eukaryotic translation initiation factor 3 subunit M-like n=1 Tax=Zophobas morio TaxID=2755281 RepID=UPI0030839A10